MKKLAIMVLMASINLTACDNNFNIKAYSIINLIHKLIYNTMNKYGVIL